MKAINIICFVLVVLPTVTPFFYASDNHPFNQYYNYDYNFDYNEMDNIEPETEEPSYNLDDLVCRDEITGEPLDWFTLYKLPKRTQILETSNTENPFIYKGTAYTYMTNKAQDEWHMSDLSMNDTGSFAGKTLDILYRTKFRRNLTTENENSENELGYILYNDQADQVSMTRGHTKGILLFNERTAIWVVHSIPHFPPKPSDSKYQIHNSQCVYGQQFFCMSIKPQELEKIGEQLLYTYPQIYDSHIPKFVKEATYFQNLLKVLDGEHTRVAPWSNLNYFKTVGGEKLLSFAKYTSFEDDLYAALVAPYFQTNLYTETWNNGRGTLESNCSAIIKYQVHNIEQLKFNEFEVRFSVHHDHSKWAVTTDRRANGFRSAHDSKKIACIGDINRQEEQYRRAGGTVCFMENENVWNQYSKLVDQVEPCKKMFRSKRISQGKKFSYPGSRSKLIMLG